VAVNRYFESQGLSLIGYTQDDGSGLSRENYVSPRFFTKYYQMMMKSDTFAEYLESFPQPGEDRGTLKRVLKDEPQEVKDRIYAKSGSLSCVKCYAGYVISAQGPIRFAILVNNGSTSKMQSQIEGFMKELSVYAGKKK
jgi:D-alanyl-D-alanine carboxypeptidase/D-alanyl-D-alanine-endopeptidase (penicillin-binding protein 4)